MNKYEIRTQEKKNSIINVALELFREKGFIAVSIKEIAAHAGVSQVSIYNYFNNKEALVRECTNILAQETLGKIKKILAEKMDFKEKLLKALAVFDDDMHQSLYDYFSSQALDDKVLLNLFTESTNQLKNQICLEYLELGKREGAIDPSISTSTIIEVMEAFRIVQTAIKPGEDIKVKKDELCKLLLYGLIGH
jgi:AcrR family transcriptional regulator